MKVVSNANQIAAQKLKMDNVVAVYKNLEESLQKKRRHYFASGMQVYITKIGIILDECISDIHIGTRTFLGSLDFICLKVIKNRQLYNLLRALEINDMGNDMKHAVKDVDVNFDLMLQQYNNLISAIVSVTKITAFNKCHLYNNSSANNLFAEKKHEKFFNVGGTNFSLSLSSKYTIDIYRKKLTTTVTFTCPEPSTKEDQVYIRIFANNSLVASREISIYASPYTFYSNNNKKIKEDIQIECGAISVNNNVLKLQCDIAVRRLERQYYQEKVLLWKKTKCTSSYKVIDIKTIQLSQIYNPKKS